jgi:hypothetical protein
MTNQFLSMLSVAATLTSACSLSVQADIPEVEVTQRAVKVPGVPRLRPAEDVSVSCDFNLSRSNSAWAKSMNSSVLVHLITVTQGKTLPNLDFVKSARFTMTDPSRSEATTEIVSYDRAPQAPSSSVIDLSPEEPVDITQLWATDTTILTLDVAGPLPVEDWSVDVTLKITGKIVYKY